MTVPLIAAVALVVTLGITPLMIVVAKRTGIVDQPTAGPGVPGPPGGC